MLFHDSNGLESICSHETPFVADRILLSADYEVPDSAATAAH